MGVKDAIPSMFIRRLLLLAVAFVAALVVLMTQSYRLTVVKGDQYLQAAEKRMVAERWTPTVRGRILDRKGRILAYDRAGFDVLVSFPVITGDWAYVEAYKQARRENSKAWFRLTGKQRDDLSRELLPAYERKVDELWIRLSKVLGVAREELDERRNRIRQDVHRIVSTTKARWLEDRIEERGILNAQGEEMSLRDVDRPLGVQQQSYVIYSGATDDKAFELRRIASELPGVEIAESGVRTYPYESMRVTVDRSHFPRPERPAKDEDPNTTITVDGIATHILGWMRNMQEEDVAKRPPKNKETGKVDRGQYLERDKVGGAGVEGSMESLLRGTRGLVRQHRDTGEEESEAAIPGMDLRLSIDVNLQARVQALLDPRLQLARLQPWHISDLAAQQPMLPVGSPLNGAAVVLDVETGEVLAMVSSPSFTRKTLEEKPETIWEDALNTPGINRATQKPYPPGSIVKPVILSSAVTEGVHALSKKIECTGHLYPDKPTLFRCWWYKQRGGTHSDADWFGGPLDAPEAIEASCNIYFYTLGRALGVEGVKKWFYNFGVGQPFNLGIGNEWPGSVMKKAGKEAPSLGDATLIGIGQGPLDWTPLHAADAYATLARGGLRIVPRVLKDATPKATDFHLDPEAVDAALKGLWLAVNDQEHGTGSHLRFDGVNEPTFSVESAGLEVRGKTGTAAAPRIFADRNDDGEKELVMEGDHSWFVVMVGPKGKQPKYTISVVMEYSGSGGKVSGPIIHQIIWALKAEGYL